MPAPVPQVPSASRVAQPPAAGGGEAENILGSFGGGAPWAPAFRAQLAPCGVVAVLRGADPSTVRFATQAPFAALDGAATARVKNDLWNALAPLADRQRVWVALFNAGLIPDAPPAAISAQRAGAPAGPAASAPSPTPPPGPSAPAPAPAKAPPPTPPAPASGAKASAPPAALSPAPAKAAGAGASPAPLASASGAKASLPPPVASPSPPAGPGAGTGAKAPTGSAPVAAPAPTPAKVGADLANIKLAPAAPAAKPAEGPAVDAAYVKDLLTRALAPRMGQTSGRYLGRDGILATWDAKKIDGLARGIGVAARFYPMFSPSLLARLVVAEGAQESTGETTLNVGGKPGDGQGFMQVTWQSVVQDYLWFGQPLAAADGQVVCDPAKPSAIDLGDLAQNVALWAWYTRNTVGSRQSLAERLMWRDPPYNNAPTDMVVDFGNAQLTWLAGPRNDRHTDVGRGRYQDYHARISDYFNQSGFAEAGQSYDQILDTKLGDDLILCARRPGQDPNHWPPAA